MVIKLGINGFGRIGRVIFRAGLQKADLEIAAINDPAIDIEYICYLMKFDSTHGKFRGCVTHTKDEILVNDCRIKVFHEKLPSSVPWQNAGVQYVLEASGLFTSLEKASGHLASESVRRVIVAAPSVDVPMVILGVNDDKQSAGLKVISCASSTLYCLAPIIKVLDDSFGVSEGFVTSIHAMTPSLKPLDGLCLRGRHWRDHRSICQNIIPATTGACRALAKIIPSVADKLSGLAFRVPIANVSVLDLSIRLNSNTTIHEIIKSVEKASKASMQNIIKISNEEAVSSDFIGESHSCVLDVDSSFQLKPNFFKLVCWYENEYSYACRVLDSIFYLEKQTQIKPLPTIANLKTKFFKKQDMIQQTDSCKQDVLCTTSEGTALKFKQSRLLMPRNPISPHNSEITTMLNNSSGAKKRNEILNMWNNNKEAAKFTQKQNRSSFFHSCVTVIPPTREEIDCINAHERLETLKQEFSKMVNITENLLKKSCINKVQDKPAMKNFNKNEISKSVNIAPEINVEEIKQSCETFSEMYERAKKSSRLLDVGSDFSKFMNKSEQYNAIQKDITQCPKSSPKTNMLEFQKKYIMLENEAKDKSKSEDILKTNTAVTLKSTNTAANRVTEIKDFASEQNCITDLEIDELVQKNKVQRDLEETKKYNKIKENATKLALESQEKKTFTRKRKIETSDSGFFSLFKKNSTAELIQIREPKNKPLAEPATQNINSEEKKATECEIKTTERESQKEMTADNVTTSANDTPSRTETITMNEENQPTTNTDNCSDRDLRKRSSEDLSRFSSPERNFTESDHTSKCGSHANTSHTLSVSNVEVFKHKQDIYDKLDSISATDSNNSFQINERKSQVINITDLTGSLEDMTRLDKICKIIEISDELSNKLFAALDTAEGIDIKKKKWSFKDLCEKLKLDDFCDQVFGKSSS